MEWFKFLIPSIAYLSISLNAAEPTHSSKMSHSLGSTASIKAPHSSAPTGSSNVLNHAGLISPNLNTTRTASSISFQASEANRAFTSLPSSSSSSVIVVGNNLGAHVDRIISSNSASSISSDTNLSPESRPFYFWIITWVLSSIAIIVTCVGIGWAIFTFRLQARKSIFDDFWFREIFFKRLSSELVEFRKKWNREKCHLLKAEVDRKLELEIDKNKKVIFRVNSEKNLIKDFLSDLAVLRDLANSIDVLYPNAKDNFEDAFDLFETIPISEDPEQVFEIAISNIHQQAFLIHNRMKESRYNFNFKSVSNN